MLSLKIDSKIFALFGIVIITALAAVLIICFAFNDIKPLVPPKFNVIKPVNGLTAQLDLLGRDISLSYSGVLAYDVVNAADKPPASPADPTDPGTKNMPPGRPALADPAYDSAGHLPQTANRWEADLRQAVGDFTALGDILTEIAAASQIIMGSMQEFYGDMPELLIKGAAADLSGNKLKKFMGPLPQHHLSTDDMPGAAVSPWLSATPNYWSDVALDLASWQIGRDGGRNRPEAGPIYPRQEEVRQVLASLQAFRQRLERYLQINHERQQYFREMAVLRPAAGPRAASVNEPAALGSKNNQGRSVWGGHNTGLLLAAMALAAALAAAFIIYKTIKNGARAVAAEAQMSCLKLTAYDFISQHKQHGYNQRSSVTEHLVASRSSLADLPWRAVDNADQLSLLARRVRHNANKGSEIALRTTQTMDEVSLASRKIGDIASAVDEIAFQTNLLALNATVEAARAGEAGKGFAALAGKVRNLSGQCSDAAKEMQALIADNVVNVEHGNALADESSQVLQAIVADVHKITDSLDNKGQAKDGASVGLMKTAALGPKWLEAH